MEKIKQFYKDAITNGWLLHFAIAYILTDIFWLQAIFFEKDILIISIFLTFLMVIKEITDKTGFSFKDIIAGYIGIGLCFLKILIYKL